MENNQDEPAGGNRIRDQFAEEAYTPIKALSTFNYDWRIKARVTKKGERRSWKNQRTEGYLMNIELMDKHGTQI
jgi:replication factor A1